MAAFLLWMLLLFGVSASAASAAPKAGTGWAYKASFGELGFIYEQPRTPVAVDSSGNIFGTDQNFGVRIYSPSTEGGTLLAEFSAVNSGPLNLAIDSSDGTVYMNEGPLTGSMVYRYVSDGAPTPTYTVDPTFEVPEGEGIAVDPTTGDLLVADPGAEGVRRYDSSGTFLEKIPTPSINPAWIVAAPDGSFYVAPADGPDVTHFSGAGTQLATISEVGSVRGLAYDASRSVVVVAAGDQLLAYSPAGVLEGKSARQGGGGVGIAVSTTGSLYEHTGSNLNYYAPGTVPGVEAPQVSGLAANSANVSAEVDPGAGPPEGSVAHFEVSADGGLNWPEELWTPDVAVERTGSNEPDTIEADLTGLKPNTDYLVRVVASNSVITSTSGSTPFHTLLAPPEVQTGPAASISDTKAELTGTIDTFGDQTTYHFEYGLTATYGSRAPVDGEAPAGMSRTPRTVSRPIGGLQPGTTYHFRLVASNSAGTTNGPDRTFVTSAAPPPVRRYEQVTPVDKKGGVVNAKLGFQAAGDGSAVSYSLAAAPADAPSAVIFTRYLSLRGSDDWLNWSPTDPPVNVPRNIVEVTTQAISSDFTHALVVSNRALTPGAEEGGGNIYVVDLRTHDYTLVGSAPGWRAYVDMSAIQTENMFLAGAPDFSWITITAPHSLLPGAPDVAMYRWSRAEGLSLQSSSTASVAQPSPGEPTVRWVSDDGNTMYYDLYGGNGAVYRRDLGGDPTPISVAEAGGDVPEGEVVSAQLDGISRDGRYVIFRTHNRLTAENPTPLGDTWMYRADTQVGDLELIGQPANAAQGSVYAIGDDANTVFYHGAGAGAGSLSWRDGVTHKFTESLLDFSLGNGPQHFASPNGRYLAYVDSREPAVHLYDAEAQTDVCVSCPPDGGSGGRDFGLPVGGRFVSNWAPMAVNNEGLLFFDTAARLIAADHNGSRDVYAYQGGELRLISSGEGNFPATFGDATPDGSVVYFTTAQSLVGQDTDGQIDVYASRLGPVFDQSAPPGGGCAGEECQGPGTPPPGGSNLGSNTSKGARDSNRSSINGIRKLSSSDLSTLARGGKARLRLKTSGPGKVSLAGTAKVGERRRRVVSASATAGKAGPVSVPFALSRVALSALNSQKSLRVSLTVRFKDARPKVVVFTLRSATFENGGRS